jgi:hypothetical protein
MLDKERGTQKRAQWVETPDSERKQTEMYQNFFPVELCVSTDYIFSNYWHNLSPVRLDANKLLGGGYLVSW